MENQTSKIYYHTKDIPMFSSWHDGKGTYFLLIDRELFFNDGKATDLIKAVCICNVKSENKVWLHIDKFNELINEKILIKTNS